MAPSERTLHRAAGQRPGGDIGQRRAVVSAIGRGGDQRALQVEAGASGELLAQRGLEPLIGGEHRIGLAEADAAGQLLGAGGRDRDIGPLQLGPQQAAFWLVPT